jgi:hypothetical protein
MSFDSKPITNKAAADLSAKLYRCGKQTPTGINVCTVAGERVDGIIGSSSAKALGDGVDFFLERIAPVEAGGVIAKGDELATDANGRAVKQTPGQYVFGIADEPATASGQYISWTPVISERRVPDVQGNNQTTPGMPVVYTFAVPDAATSDIDIVVTDKIEVIDVICRKDAGAGAGNTMTVKNGATAISNAIACDTDKTITRAGTIDVANNTILAGGTLRLTAARAAGTRTALVTVVALKRA